MRRYSVRASSHTGRGISFAHQGDDEDVDVEGTLDQSIRKYLREFFAGAGLDASRIVISSGTGIDESLLDPGEKVVGTAIAEIIPLRASGSR